MDEVRSKDRSIVELESQMKKLAEYGHKNQLREVVRTQNCQLTILLQSGAEQSRVVNLE